MYSNYTSLYTESWTRLSDFTFTFHFHALEREMATHSGVLAWRIPGMAEPGGLPSMGLQSRTRLKPLCSSSSIQGIRNLSHPLNGLGGVKIKEIGNQQLLKDSSCGNKSSNFNKSLPQKLF